MNIKKEKLVLGLGVWLIVLPFLGFPETWKMVLTVVTGVIITYVGALLLKRSRMPNSLATETKTETFTETS